MKVFGGIFATGAALAAIAVLVGCASYPTMSVNRPDPRSAEDRSAAEAAIAGAPGRGGDLRASQNQPQTVPGLGPSRSPAEPATPEQIAALVPDAPLSATLTPQPIAQYLNTLFSDVLRLPYSLGPGVAQRNDIITINAPANRSRRDYVLQLQGALRGYGLTLSVVNNAFVISDNGATAAGGAQTPIIRSRSSADTPVGNRQVIQFFQLVALRADAVIAAFGTGTSDVKQIMGAAATPDPAANAIVLQGSGTVVARAVEFLRNVDQPAYAGAQVVRLEPIFWAPDAFAQALAATLQAEGFIVAADPLAEKSIMILPLPATNQTLVFAADAATMARVQYWARELDQPSSVGDQATTFVYEVRNTSAATIGQMLVNAGAQAGRAGIGPGGGFNGAVGAAVGGGGGNAQQAGRGGGNNNQGRGGGQNNQGRGGGNQGRAGGAQGQFAAQAQGGAGRAGTNVAGAVPTGGVITVDDASNRILFTGSPSQFAQLRALLRQLDIPAREVLVEVTVAEVTLTDETAIGVEWFFEHSGNSATTYGGTMTRVPAATAGDPPTFVSNLGLGTSGLTAVFENGDLRGAFQAFASNNKVNVLSRPRISARSGSSARINVGVDAPIVIGQDSTDSGNGIVSRNSYQYRETGVILEIVPTVYGDDRVDIQVYQEVSSIRDNTNPDIDSPFIDLRTVETTLSLADGRTAVLGGLMQDNYGKGNTGIPFLKDIPILGTIFRADQVRGAKTELMVLITPFIIRNDDDMTLMTQQAIDEVNAAFRVSRGGSYTLTPWAGGRSLGLNPPNPVITGSSLQRPVDAGAGRDPNP